ncbi:hypothetical protein L2725_02465 [Shewanella corallii]|uniref:Uncharacterized protein n=1 Tax=Shewanella corallii TaxID=560080 RepID=A0ABT0N4D5_9GAMM|nr:hypothetical protein [Shewanella corallii]MCL2912652.1 hypothetical protein [Shewanella corallii]
MRRKTRSMWFSGLLCLLCSLVLTPAYATKLKPQNLTSLIKDANSIIIGQVTNVTDGFNEKGLPYTEVTINVGRSLKGKMAQNKPYTFRQFGLLKPRKMENGNHYLGISPEGFPRWHKDENVMLFMYQPAKITGFQTTAGLTQGKLLLVAGKAANSHNNYGLFDDLEFSKVQLTSAENKMLGSSGPADLQVLTGLIEKAVSKQWIERGVMK